MIEVLTDLPMTLILLYYSQPLYIRFIVSAVSCLVMAAIIGAVIVLYSKRRYKHG